jgi:transcriptional regulator CtsR
MKKYYIESKRRGTSYKRTSKANWIGHTLRMNRLLKHVIEQNIEEKMEMKERLGRRCKQLLDDFKEKEKDT